MIYGIYILGTKGIVRLECDPRQLEAELKSRGAAFQFSAETEEEFQSKKRQYDEQFSPEW
jgi:hypothetical protein